MDLAIGWLEPWIEIPWVLLPDACIPSGSKEPDPRTSGESRSSRTCVCPHHRSHVIQGPTFLPKFRWTLWIFLERQYASNGYVPARVKMLDIRSARVEMGAARSHTFARPPPARITHYTGLATFCRRPARMQRPQPSPEPPAGPPETPGSKSCPPAPPILPKGAARHGLNRSGRAEIGRLRGATWEWIPKKLQNAKREVASMREQRQMMMILKAPVVLVRREDGDGGTGVSAHLYSHGAASAFAQEGYREIPGWPFCKTHDAPQLR
ncbi:hypothetical protein B0H19DRAFT_1082483 [Mycena capillaripes]|nr:hypothetical protein B0H19DRAFT_1082483 [Mycena capillaripes]